MPSATFQVRAVNLFRRCWAALREAVADLEAEHFAELSGCTGWLVRDLVCHLIIDAQDVLITLVTPADSPPTRDSATYWEVVESLAVDNPLDALTVRLAAAYGEPSLLKFHLDDIGSAAGRAADLADPDARVGTRGQVLTIRDYLDAYVLEWTLHHLDLIAHLPDAPPPPAEGLSFSRRLFETIAGAPLPATWPDADALLIGTGRRPATSAEHADLAADGVRIPLILS
jgi:hypothetical protein